MRSLVQDRVENHVFAVRLHERLADADHLFIVSAKSDAPNRAVEFERPPLRKQAVILHVAKRQGFGFPRVHTSTVHAYGRRCNPVGDMDKRGQGAPDRESIY